MAAEEEQVHGGAGDANQRPPPLCDGDGAGDSARDVGAASRNGGVTSPSAGGRLSPSSAAAVVAGRCPGAPDSFRRGRARQYRKLAEGGSSSSSSDSAGGSEVEGEGGGGEGGAEGEAGGGVAREPKRRRRRKEKKQLAKNPQELASIIGRQDEDDGGEEDVEAALEVQGGSNASKDRLKHLDAAAAAIAGDAASAATASLTLPSTVALSKAEWNHRSTHHGDHGGHHGHGATPKGKSSNLQTFTNAIICFVGSGVLGLPFAFRHVGLVGGVLGLTLITMVSLHCMYLMVDSKKILQERALEIRDYADVGFHAFGIPGQVMVSCCILLTQTGFCIAYLIFISESMREVQSNISKRMWIAICMPLLVVTSWLRSLKAIAKISFFAALSITLALFMVLAFDLQELATGGRSELDYGSASHLGTVKETHHHHPHKGPKPDMEPREHDQFGGSGHLVILNFRGIPYFFGVAVYCFEGIGMVLPVLNGMQKPASFKAIWGAACMSVSSLYILFGLLGYAAFRGEVADVITTNLPPFYVTNFMKVALCVGLLLTYPLMCVPVIEEVERRLGRTTDDTRWHATLRNMLRSGFVFGTGIVAYMVPKFGVFISLVGASASAALAFVLPSLFFLKISYSRLNGLQRSRELGCMLFGILGGVVGTMSALQDMREALR